VFPEMAKTCVFGHVIEAHKEPQMDEMTKLTL